MVGSGDLNNDRPIQIRMLHNEGCNIIHLKQRTPEFF